MVELETTVSTTSTTTNITLVGDLFGSLHLELYRLDGINSYRHAFFFYALDFEAGYGIKKGLVFIANDALIV